MLPEIITTKPLTTSEPVLPLKKGFMSGLARAIHCAEVNGTKVAVYAVDPGRALSEFGTRSLKKKIGERLGIGVTVTATTHGPLLVYVSPLFDVPMVNHHMEELFSIAKIPSTHWSEAIDGMPPVIGVTIYPDDSGMANELVAHAIDAMCQARRAGGATYKIFDTNNWCETMNAHRISTAVGMAMRNNQIELHYQPKVNLHSGAVIGAEALVRWRNSSNELIYPGQFLPYIQSVDTIVALDMYVLEEAVRQSVRWMTYGLSPVVSVNISPVHFNSMEFVTQVETILAKVPDFNPQYLALEILEIFAIKDLKLASEIITQLRKLGIQFYLDDFGTGHSSAAYLKMLSVDAIKIDQIFARDFPSGPSSAQDRAIIGASLSVARAFDLAVIVEGVETQSAADEVRKIGCDIAQGYYFSKALPGDDFVVWCFSNAPN